MKKVILLFLFFILLSVQNFSQTFTNVASQLGINATYNDRFYYIPGGGIGFADYDNDGDPDFIVATSTKFVLYRNDGDHFTDVTAQSGINFTGDALKSVIWGDY